MCEAQVQNRSERVKMPEETIHRCAISPCELTVIVACLQLLTKLLAKEDRAKDYSPVLLTEKGDEGQEVDHCSHRRHGEQRSQMTMRRAYHSPLPSAHNSRALTRYYEHPARIHTPGQHSNGRYYYSGIETAFNAYS